MLFPLLIWFLWEPQNPRPTRYTTEAPLSYVPRGKRSAGCVAEPVDPRACERDMTWTLNDRPVHPITFCVSPTAPQYIYMLKSELLKLLSNPSQCTRPAMTPKEVWTVTNNARRDEPIITLTKPLDLGRAIAINTATLANYTGLYLVYGQRRHVYCRIYFLVRQDVDYVPNMSPQAVRMKSTLSPVYTSRIKRSTTETDTSNLHHLPTHNVWWKLMNFTKSQTNISEGCYVCSLIPHTHTQNPMWTPVPASVNTTMCALWSYTKLAVSSNLTVPWCNDSYLSQEQNWRSPMHFSNSTNSTNVKGIHVGRSPPIAPLAFFSKCHKHSKFLGNSKSHVIIPVPGWTCTGQDMSFEWKTKSSNNASHCSFGLIQLNATAFMLDQNYAVKPGLLSSVMFYGPGPFGYPAPYKYVWVCGYRVFLYLPEHWCGTCHLARLAPAVGILEFGSNTIKHDRVKRAYTLPAASTKQANNPLISDARGVFMTMFPMYGTAYLGRRMNEVWWALENITDILTDITAQLRDNPEIRAVRAMLTMHQMALDYLFASEGGLCVKFGIDHCCTYIPDSTHNWTQIHDKVADLKQFLADNKDPAAFNFDLGNWFLSGSWLQIIFKFLAPVLAILVLFCVFVTCCIPCLKAIMQKMIQSALGPVNAALFAEEQVQLLILDPDDDGPDDDPYHR